MWHQNLTKLKTCIVWVNQYLSFLLLVHTYLTLASYWAGSHKELFTILFIYFFGILLLRHTHFNYNSVTPVSEDFCIVSHLFFQQNFKIYPSKETKKLCQCFRHTGLILLFSFGGTWRFCKIEFSFPGKSHISLLISIFLFFSKVYSFHLL